MFETSVRVRPWSSLWVFDSSGRSTSSVPSLWLTAMSGWSSRLSVPFGPTTVIARPSIVTVTPGGTAMGRRPILDMRSLPYQT